MTAHQVVSRAEWLEARKELLELEKAHTRTYDEIRKERVEHPWVRVDKEYLFDTPSGRQTLADLFDGKSQLIVQHFMFGPGWDALCPGCTFLATHMPGALLHFPNHDVAFVAVSRAPLAEIERARAAKDWDFTWVSSYGSDFNRDFHASVTREDVEDGREVLYNFQPAVAEEAGEISGHSSFYKDEDGVIYHTYSTYARGADRMLTTHNFLDMTPKGRSGA